MDAHVRVKIGYWSDCLSATLIVLVTACANAPALESRQFASDTALLHAMLIAEDARPETAEALEPLRRGLASPEAVLRAWAARGIGRLERDSLAPLIAPALRDPSPAVRTAAAAALAQSVHRGDAGVAREALLRQLPEETDADVLGALAEALGRLRPGGPQDVRSAAEHLIAVAGRSSELAAAHSTTLLGVARGLFFLTRRPDAGAALPPGVARLLGSLVTYGRHADGGANEPDSATLTARRIRRLALAATMPTGAATPAMLDSALADPDPFVRREAALAAGALADSTAGLRLAQRAMRDPAATVRYEAVRAVARLAGDAVTCDNAKSAVNDADAHVVLLALDLLGARCAAAPDVAAVLDSISSTDLVRWYFPAHAIVALAAADPERAALRLPAFASSANPFVRTYAAVAATRLRDEAVLRELARDAHPNVRTAAVQGLSTTSGHAADAVYLAQLTQDDSQLLQAAAAALEASTDAAALPALLAALERITARGRETDRDARVALLERITELGNTATAQQLQPYARDFDPAVARRAAEALSRWTGSVVAPAPRRLPLHPVPSPAELAALSGTRLVIQMEDGGEIELRLSPYTAPTNTARFVRLARTGYYDRLTLHRVVPNFVLQGGSPNANEYAGDGPYTRDEVGAPNWRGTLGLSTRGRDTGDAQLYINLVDNIRLDPDYTVWAEVVRGVEVMERVLEGAVMRRISVR